jgi:hypothetical protein
MMVAVLGDMLFVPVGVGFTVAGLVHLRKVNEAFATVVVTYNRAD